MIQASGLNHEIERLADAIRDVFLVDRDLSESAAQKLHNELLAYVTTVNARLKKCDELLRRGLRQEALQESEEEPNLLELVTQLDFPEWDAWADYVTQYGFPPQPPLLLDVAAELNQAYTTAQSLEGLLKLHRLHALARSPLATRLTVLRAISTRDPTNPSWQQDLKSYELARLKQLQGEFKAHLREGNLRALAELRREIDSANWSIPPQANLVSEVIAGHQRLIAEDARRHLELLESNINAAFAAFDLARLQQAHERWNHFWPLANLPADDELAVRVRAAFSWLEDEINQQTRQAEYERDLAALESALDDDTSRRHDLVRQFEALQRYEDLIPARLQRRYDERMLSLDLATRRRHRLMLISSVAVVILVATAIGFLTYQQLRRSEIAAAEQALREFANENRPLQGTQFYEQLRAEKPTIASAPQVQAAYSRVQGQLTEELERQDRLTRLLLDAEELLKTPNWESASAAGKLLQQANDLAATEERVSILKVDRTYKQVIADLQSTVDQQFEKDASALMKLAGSDRQLNMTEARGYLQEAQSLQARPRVSNVARQASGIDILVQKLNDRIKHLTQTQNVQELLQNVISASGRTSAYQLALQRYLEFDLNSPRANDFRQVLDQDIALINDQGSWNAVANHWNDLSLASTTDASAALKLIDTLNESFPEFPLVNQVLDLKPYLDSIAARQKPDGTTLVGELRELFKENLFNAKQIKNPRQTGYLNYFGEPLQRGSVVEMSVLLDSRDWNKTKPYRFSLEQFTALQTAKQNQDSPQKLFADRANRTLANKKVSYEHSLCAVLHILFTDRDMDPILKCWLLQVFYDRGATGSSILAEELRGFRNQLESKYALGDTNFLEQSDPQVNTIRANTADLLARVSETPKDVFLQRIQPRVQKVIDETVVLPRIEWCGALLKSTDRSWIVETSRVPTGKGELALLQKSESGNLRLKLIGNFDGKALVLTELETIDYFEGKPVYLIAYE